MSLAGWYFHKADQCAKMAKEASDPLRRTVLKEEEERWRELAAGIDGQKEITPGKPGSH